MTKTYKYKFSFVMPIYNVEAYLAETVESILAQTMDFEQNCEIIFVNDGSPDNSEEICLRYKEQFPDNVKYIRQENAGPGAARNRGTMKARGKYISFLDSDDKISPNTLDEVYKFFEKHFDEIDLVSIKTRFFEAREGDHPLNYKYTVDRVIDLTKEFDQIQMSVSSAFIKTEMLQKNHKFEESVGRYAEDCRLAGEILLDKQKFGVVTKPIYFYRKRNDQASSLDTTITDKFWYLETPKRAWQGLFQYAKKHTGEIPKFIQFMVMYDLQWRIRQKVQVVLTDKEVKQYKSLLYDLLRDVDNDVIMAQRNITAPYKIFALEKKHGDSVLKNATKKGSKYVYRGTEVYDLSRQRHAVHVEILEAQDNSLQVEGYFDGSLFGGDKLQLKVGDAVVNVELENRRHRRLEFLGEIVSGQNCFKASVPVEADVMLEAYISGHNTPLPLDMRRFSYISRHVNHAYRVAGDFILRRNSRSLFIQRFTHLRRLKCELMYLATLAKRLKLRVTMEQYARWKQLRASRAKVTISDLKWVLVPAKSLARNAIVITFRLTYFFVKPFYRRPIWLVSDRMMVADDSGEILFHYLRRQRSLKIKSYYVLSKKSKEFARVKALGGVVKYFSFPHKLLFLLSDKVISSHADDYVINAFGGRVDDLIDLYGFDFVFLQHGIIKDDISNWLNRYNKNIQMFVTSTKPEYESITHGDYGYDKKVIKLTGLPRHDNLRSDPKNKLILAPTWRENLAGGPDIKTGFQAYNVNFKKSEYYRFYQQLINDSQLVSVMQKYDFIGEFFLHPALQIHIQDFSGNERIKVMQMPYDYPKMKREGSLLVTDYSSVAFDFAYLRKPILYTHFDQETFYKQHISREGYFSYEKDGLGPVAYDYENTVKEIIKNIESGCKMVPKYQKRVEKFFAYNDRNNSERVYKAILEMDGKKS